MDNMESESDEIDEQLNIPDKTEHKHWKTKLMLIDEIKRIVGMKGSGKKNLNIAVIGTPGCGKSSFINTVLTSLRKDNWNLYSVIGQNMGDISSITQHFKSFSANKMYYKEQPKVLLPTFIDINGLENNNDGFNREFLRALFEGKIKENEQLTTLKELYKNQSKFKKEISRRPTYLKVDRIIVVTTSDPDAVLATELFKCIREAADAVKGIPIFGVMTKKDLFRNNQQVAERKTNFLGHLGITDESYKWVQNYCPDIDGQLRYQRTVYPQIDVPVLLFINQVINPHLSRDYINYLPGPCGRLILKIVSYLCRFIQILIWLFLLIVLTTLYIYDDNNIDVCTAYNKLSQTHDFTLPSVGKFCKQEKNAGFFFIILPVAVSLLLFAIPPLVRRILRIGTQTWIYLTMLIVLPLCMWVYYNYRRFAMKL